MRKIYLSILSLALFGFAAGAQGFDPTVEVSRNYQSTLKYTPKPVTTMAVPDSLLRFDLDFDYSVFDKPYKGTGDFRPYLLDLQPHPDAYRGKKLYLKAGLGYTLHPEVDFVYSPETGKKSDINIYAQHRSYFGKYDFLDWWEFTGYDSYTKAGVNGKTGLGAAQLLYNVNYKGILTKDKRVGRDGAHSSLNALEAMAGLRSAGKSDLIYSAIVNLSFGGDKISIYDKSLSYFKVGFDGGIGKKMDDYIIAADVHFGRTSYSFEQKANIGNWYIAPRYISEKDGFRLNLGIKLGSVMHSGNSWFDGFAMDMHKSQVIYPDAHVAYELDPGAMDFYADLTGGDDVLGYEDIRERDHFAMPRFTDNSLVHFNLNVGLRGNVNTVFRYDVTAGFRSVGHAALYAMNSDFITMKVYENMQEPYLRANFTYDCKPLIIEGRVFLRGASVNKSSKDLARDYGIFQVFTPRKASVDINAMYLWKSRIKAGVTARLGSGISGCVETTDFPMDTGILTKSAIGGYADLGLHGEYSLDRMVSIYARIGNLLNKKYLSDVMMPVSGLYLTAGIIINM